MIKFEKSRIPKEAGYMEKPLPIWGAIVIFIFVWGISMRFLYPFLYSLPLKSNDSRELVTLFGHVIPMGIYICIGKFIEHRPLSTIGITKKKLFRHLIVGILFGVAIYGIFLLIGLGFGAIRICKETGPVFLLCYLLGYFFQSAEEEIAVRGWLMTSLMKKFPTWAAVLFSAVLFTIPHYISRGGMQRLYILNVFLAGILLSMIFLSTNSVWAGIGCHTFLNWVSCIIGALGVGGPSYFKYITVKYSFLTGGRYGFTAGMGMTIAQILGILAVIFCKKIRNQT